MFQFVAKIIREWKPEPKQVRYTVIPRDPCRVRMHEWRSTPDLVQRAAKYLNDPNFRIMLDILDRENPANEAFPFKMTIEERAIQQARCEGYVMAIANLESLGVPDIPKEALEATFEPEEDRETAQQP